MRTRRLATNLALLTLLLGGLLTVTPPRARADGGTAGEACFAETGFCVRGRFLAYWQQHGGLAINGFPLGDERQEILEDGNTYTVQYFERVRLEYHPENAAPYDVLLGQFGRRILSDQYGADPAGALPAARPTDPVAGQGFFAETRHTLAGGFQRYWEANGGLTQFGFALTEPFQEQEEDGNTYTVQYFERARLEYHPENPVPYDVLLGQFGRDILTQRERLTGGVGTLFIADARVRGLLGAPLGPTVQAQGATQAFERGRMFLYRERPGATGLITVLCGDEQAGQVFTTSRYEPYFLDPWDPSQPVGGGPGPQPGLYEPQRGFGRVWRENGSYLGGQGSAFTRVRDCLGYATTPDETAFLVATQSFARGIVLSTPDGRAAYALYREPLYDQTGRQIGVDSRYERLALPPR